MEDRSAHGLIKLTVLIRPWAKKLSPRPFLFGEMNRKNITLIGYRCTGKSTTGRIIAKRLFRLFVDTDTLIERLCSMPIWKIVEDYGWIYFRHLESVISEALSRESNLVIATGGGMVINPDNAQKLASNSIMIWLKASPEIIKQRLKRDIDSGKILPSISAYNSIDEVDTVLMEREPHYKNASHFTITTDNMTPEEVAQSIIKIYHVWSRRQ